MNLRTVITTTIGAELAVAALVAGGTVTAARSAGPDLPARAHFMRTLCPTEESTDCAWNAQTEGNGIGHSFYSVTRELIGPNGHKRGRVTCVFYVKLSDARAWDACHLLPHGAPTHP